MEKSEAIQEKGKRIINSVLKEINMLDGLAEKSSADVIKYFIKADEEK